MNSVEFL